MFIKYLSIYFNKLKIIINVLFQVFLKLFNTSCIKKTDSFISAFVLRPETNKIVKINYQIMILGKKL